MASMKLFLKTMDQAWMKRILKSCSRRNLPQKVAEAGWVCQYAEVFWKDVARA